MKAKSPFPKSAKPTKAPGNPENSGDLILTPLEKVRLMIDYAIEFRRCKSSDIRRKLKESLDQFPFGSIETFRHLNAAAEATVNDLAFELAAPAQAVIGAISKMAAIAHGIAANLKHEEWPQAAERVSKQVDFALALIMRALIPRVRAAAMNSNNDELLCEVLNILIGDGHEAEKGIRRFQQLFPGSDCDNDGNILSNSFAHEFAWDTYQRVAALERLVYLFPENVGTAARQMNAWPMLRYCHNDRKKKFEQIVNMLELGADYPLDVSKRPAWRPDTMMVQYVDDLVCKFDAMDLHWQSLIRSGREKTQAAEKAASAFGEGAPSKETIKVLIATFDLPKLTKETSELWGNRAIVPYAMVTDAKTSTSCGEPALQAI